MLYVFSGFSALGKMAEVGQRLGSGAYRLSALRNRQSRPVSTGESPGSLLVSCSRLKEESARDQREVVSKSKRKTGKVSRVRTGGSQQESGALSCSTSLQLDSPRFIRLKAQHLLAGLQPLLLEDLLPGRMKPWTRGAVCIHAETFRSPQQMRAFCTVVFILSEQGSDGRRRLKLHPDTQRAPGRSYSWRRDSSTKDAPPLYRSRTAYYEILSVSPEATQAQIKTAYYEQSFIYHPDKNQGDKEATLRFAEISEAYTVLGNISLRRKYDRGILSRSDVQGAGRPSSKESPSRSTGPPQQQPPRARRFSQAGGRTMFDFDAFYQAHYGEQLQRQREMKARKEYMEQRRKEQLDKWKQEKKMELTVAMLVAMGCLIFVSLCKP